MQVTALQSHFFVARYESFGTRLLGRWASKSKAARARKQAAASSGGVSGEAAKNQLFLQACGLAAGGLQRASSVGGNSTASGGPPPRAVAEGEGGPAQPPRAAGGPLTRVTAKMNIIAAFERMLMDPDAIDD